MYVKIQSCLIDQRIYMIFKYIYFNGNGNFKRTVKFQKLKFINQLPNKSEFSF